MLNRRPDSTRAFTPRFLALAMAAAVLAAGSPALAAKGGSKGKPPKADKADKADKHENDAGTHDSHEANEARDDSRYTQVLSNRSFGRRDERAIRDWFSRSQNLAGLPPGLAKRESLPPGLQKQVMRRGTLPPGLESKLHPLPDNLARQLPRLPDGIRRVVVDRDVLLVENRNDRILDILRNVLPAMTGTR